MWDRRGWAGSFALPSAAAVLLCAASRVEGEGAQNRVHVGNAFAAVAVRGALEGAARRLASPSCRKLLTEFTDRAGQTLQSNLEARGLTVEAHLRSLRFEDGVGVSRCNQQGIFAVTTPGSPVVYICAQPFLAAYRINSYVAEGYVIHEMLHSLGLGESPPRSEEITDRVNAACRN